MSAACLQARLVENVSPGELMRIACRTVPISVYQRAKHVCVSGSMRCWSPRLARWLLSHDEGLSRGGLAALYSDTYRDACSSALRNRSMHGPMMQLLKGTSCSQLPCEAPQVLRLCGSRSEGSNRRVARPETRRMRGWTSNLARPVAGPPRPAAAGETSQSGPA